MPCQKLAVARVAIHIAETIVWQEAMLNVQYIKLVLAHLVILKAVIIVLKRIENGSCVVLNVYIYSGIGLPPARSA